MCRLNYNDLMALLIEYDIDEVNKNMKQLEQERQNANGVEIVNASNREIFKR